MLIRNLSLVDYPPTYQAMQAFTASRSASTPDELWICEHPPVYTRGRRTGLCCACCARGSTAASRTAF